MGMVRASPSMTDIRRFKQIREVFKPSISDLGNLLFLDKLYWIPGGRGRD